jgi:hypothetical protein
LYRSEELVPHFPTASKNFPCHALNIALNVNVLAH